MCSGGAFNRTNVELKYIFFIHKFPLKSTFNRTNVELKLIIRN